MILVFLYLRRPMPIEEILTIEIRPGWKKGTKITFPEKGNGQRGVIAADLVFIIDEKPHGIFKREGNDLTVTQKLSLVEALTGYTVQYSVLGSAANIGAMVGALTSGRISNIIGRKGGMWISSVFCFAGWLAVYFPKGAVSIDIGRLSTGYGMGLFSYVVLVFISEIAPKNLRGGLATLNQVDLEHNHYRSFQGLTCLIQISSRSEDFVVDTLKLHAHVGPHLRDVFKDHSKKKVMHGADRDIVWLQRDFGIYVCNIFDTGQASRVLNLERNSLEYLLHHFCGVTANKEFGQ